VGHKGSIELQFAWFVVNQDMLQSSRLIEHYLLVLGIRLFIENNECVTNNGISLEKKWDWDFWDSPRNDWSSELDNVVGGQDATRKYCVDATNDCVPRSAIIELFIRHACIGMRNIVKIWSKMAVKGQFAARRTQFLVVSLTRSLLLARLHLLQALKMRD
jgi:hypothetical protein